MVRFLRSLSLGLSCIRIHLANVYTLISAAIVLNTNLVYVYTLIYVYVLIFWNYSKSWLVYVYTLVYVCNLVYVYTLVYVCTLVYVRTRIRMQPSIRTHSGIRMQPWYTYTSLVDICMFHYRLNRLVLHNDGSSERRLKIWKMRSYVSRQWRDVTRTIWIVDIVDIRLK